MLAAVERWLMTSLGKLEKQSKKQLRKIPKFISSPKKSLKFVANKKKESVSTANCTRPETNLLPQHKAASEFIPLGGLTNSVARSRNPKQTKSFH